MIFIFRLIYACAAFFSIAAASLTVASLFIADRAPQSMEFLGISLVVGAIFAGIGMVLIGIRRHVTAVATLAQSRSDADAQMAIHINRLLAYLLAGGALLCAALGMLTYAILARIDQGFAVFG